MKKYFVIVLIAAFALPSAASIDLGVQAGVSSGPDQFFAGARLDLGTILPHWNLVAIADLGLGEEFTLLSLSGDLLYEFSLGGVIRLYTGVGIGYNWHLGGMEIGIGIEIPVGIKLEKSYFIEARFGFENNPEFKICAGFFL